jgi:ring-1,2-phenylacetyl-CoA epoxidase subunit PaaC
VIESADIARYAVRLGDDALILGHRVSEWTSRAPFLEEDLAMTNVALDYVGRARMFYQYAAELTGGETTEDTFAYTRDAREFTNLLLCELPRGDFAHSVVRQFFYDAYALPMLRALKGSKDERLAAIAGKAEKESVYHLRRGKEWMLRLGDGTEESHARMQTAVDELWGYTHELFETDELDQRLIDEGIAVDCGSLRDEWQDKVTSTLTEATLTIPDEGWSIQGGRTGYHTEHLGFLLAELQFMQRAYPGLQW